LAVRYNNNDQAMGSQNINISGVCKYAVADYGASWADTTAIDAALLALFPDPVNGDLVILRNTNGTDESRVYFRAADAWEALPSTTIGAGAVETDKLADGVLSADAAGRAKMADNLFDAATILAKIADGAFAADADTRALFADGIWNLAKLAQEAKTHVFTYQVEALAADGDIAARPILVAPAGFVTNIVSASIVPQGSSSGIDDSNKSTWALLAGANTLVSKEFDADPAFPASGATTDLGTISTDYDNVAAGTQIKLSVTNGTTAATPATLLQIVYYFTAA
jgi:hypothetical protein